MFAYSTTASSNSASSGNMKWLESDESLRSYIEKLATGKLRSTNLSLLKKKPTNSRLVQSKRSTSGFQSNHGEKLVTFHLARAPTLKKAVDHSKWVPSKSIPPSASKHKTGYEQLRHSYNIGMTPSKMAAWNRAKHASSSLFEP